MCTEGEQAVRSATQVANDAVAFDATRVNTALAGTLFAGKVHHFAQVESTQTLALHAAQAGAEAGQVYVADAQSAGRGRGGHTWASPADDGLYLTVMVRPTLQASEALTLSLATGLAVQQAILTVTQQQVDLRWPNDLVTRGAHSQKLGGILTESAMLPDGTLRYAAIGIGVNLNQATMPAEVADVATSLFRLSGRHTSREDMLLAILRQLDAELRGVEQNAAETRDRFAAASTWVHGKRVHVAEQEGYTGTTAGLDRTGLLRVRCDSGELRTVRHGGVRALP